MPCWKHFVKTSVLGYVCVCLVMSTARAQFQAEHYALTADERQTLTQGCEHLKQELDTLRKPTKDNGKPVPDFTPDVQIFLDAAERNLQQNLFFSKQNVQQAQACLAEGEARAAALKENKADWMHQTGVVVLGYRSRLDGSAQPYQVYIPPDYDFATPRPQRLDIFLHGRGGNLNEPTFIRGTGWVKGNFGGQLPANIALYPYGRGNNGWRFAGEQDVFEALADCKRRYRVDENRIVLRGFSMGGHGTWHIGLQHPGLWAAISPGAGFVETKRYHKITETLPEWQEQLLHLYDPLDYALNARDVSTLHYVGETDTFHAQHEIMDTVLKQEDAPYQEFIGPKTGHAYEKQTLQMLLTALAPARRDPDGANIDFVTYTLRWPECKWVKIEGLEHHWMRTEVHAKRTAPDRLEVNTRNVTTLELTPPDWKPGGTVVINGEILRTPGKAVKVLSLHRLGGKWALAAASKTRKKPGLQGPIDDALFEPVLAVAGTGTPWNEAAHQWAGQELARFREGWGLYCRATLPEKTDTSLIDEDIKNHNLYLFGDPGSNAVLRRLLPKLPVQWTKDKIILAGKTFAASEHLPLLIFPNPENPERYVVLNCGFTFSRADWNGSNSQQYPHLPDYAVIRLGATFSDDRAKDTVLAGFFDENWQVPAHK